MKPAVNFSNKVYSPQEAYELIDQATADVSKEYQAYTRFVLGEGRVDLLPRDNKMTGAYSSGDYLSGPVILHNFNGTLNSVYTIIHEAGHSIHSKMAIENQTFFNANYSIYLAEIASTFAERTLDDYLLNHVEDNETLKTLLEESVISTISTFYRQTLFADFEYQVHELVDKGEALNATTLSNIMKDLYKIYYDMDLDLEKSKRLVWAYIPHLTQYPFYVYQYSTCLAASLNIYETYSQDKQKGLDKLYKILKAGGSDYPDKILLESGIDLSKEETYLSVSNILEKTIDKLIELD